MEKTIFYCFFHCFLLFPFFFAFFEISKIAILNISIFQKSIIGMAEPMTLGGRVHNWDGRAYGLLVVESIIGMVCRWGRRLNWQAGERAGQLQIHEFTADANPRETVRIQIATLVWSQNGYVGLDYLYRQK